MTDNVDVPDDMTREEYRESISKAPQPKVIAATSAAVVGVPIAEVGIWIFETATTIDIPTNIEVAIAAIFTAGITFLAGYFKSN